MKFKMRAMFYPETGNAEKIALTIAKDQEIDRDRIDRIPPAYPCEKERLLFIGVELKGSSVPKPVIALCNDLKPDRARNVAFFAIGGGSFDKMNELREIVQKKGVNVAGSTFECPSSGLLKKTIADADVQKTVAWAAEIVESLRD